MPRTVPAPLFHAGAVALEAAFGLLGKEPPVSRRTMRFFTGNTAFDISRARATLGYEPRYDLASGLGETAEILAIGPFRVPLPERSAP
jgi:nucleoside-diphosphate-sugar epimerase